MYAHVARTTNDLADLPLSIVLGVQGLQVDDVYIKKGIFQHTEIITMKHNQSIN